MDGAEEVMLEESSDLLSCGTRPFVIDSRLAVKIPLVSC